MPLVFQSFEEWKASELGLHPIQVALQVSLPEIDGAIEPIIFAGREGVRLLPTHPTHLLPPAQAKPSPTHLLNPYLTVPHSNRLDLTHPPTHLPTGHGSFRPSR